MSSVTEVIQSSSGAEQVGATIGAGIGLTFIISTWVAGDIILGLFVLFTRPKS